MSLPKIKYPTFEVEIPSTKQKVRIRPMLVREEKILLTAKEGKARNEIYIAIRNVIRNCLVDVDPAITDKLTTFDMEYLFLKIRAKSVGDTTSLLYTDPDDDEEYKIDVDLEKVVVKYPKKSEDNIKLSDTASISLRYPLAVTYESKIFGSEDSTEEELFEEFILSAMDMYWEGETAVQFKDQTPDDIKEFLNDLDIKTYAKIKTFVSSLPSLYYEAKYKTKDGEAKTLKLTSLLDFFMF